MYGLLAVVPFEMISITFTPKVIHSPGFRLPI